MELRDRIIEAAELVIRSNGLSRTTTKEIARIAGCSEGSLYNHFQSKEDLFIQVMKRQVGEFIIAVLKLPNQIGIRTVSENLKGVTFAALEYYHTSIIMTASMFTEPEFLTRHRQGFVEHNEGPHRANEVMTAYLEGEKKLGRVNADINPRSAADMLLGACFQHAFHLQFLGVEELREAKQKFVENLMHTLMLGLQQE